MAEIHIERRTNPRLLPWLVGLAILAAVVFMVARMVGPWSGPPESEADGGLQPVGAVVYPDPGWYTSVLMTIGNH